MKTQQVLITAACSAPDFPVVYHFSQPWLFDEISLSFLRLIVIMVKKQHNLNCNNEKHWFTSLSGQHHKHV